MQCGPNVFTLEAAVRLLMEGRFRGLTALDSQRRPESHLRLLQHRTYLSLPPFHANLATDLTIHKVFKSDAKLEHALREEFLDHVRGYAMYQQCTLVRLGIGSLIATSGRYTRLVATLDIQSAIF